MLLSMFTKFIIAIHSDHLRYTLIIISHLGLLRSAPLTFHWIISSLSIAM